MTEAEVLLTVDGAVATITLNRPEKLNAVTTSMTHAVVAAFDETDANDDVRAVIVTGAGSAFCAGADLSAGESSFDRTDATRGEPFRDSGGTVALRVMQSLKPVIAAVNGHAVGFGASLTLPMDYRVFSSSAKIGFVFGARGIGPDAASSWFLPRAVGMNTALDWMLTGRVFKADEALEAGLATDVVEAESVLGVAQAHAERIAESVAPCSAAVIRRLLWRNSSDPTPWNAHVAESAALEWLGRSDDAREGVTSFQERRPPQWSGRVSELEQTGLLPQAVASDD